jgi:hypothetical protein
MTDDIFMAEILGHKLLPGVAALSVGQSYKDFLCQRRLNPFPISIQTNFSNASHSERRRIPKV